MLGEQAFLFPGFRENDDIVLTENHERRYPMLKMMEVVGTSPLGFSEAVKNGIEKLLESGEKIHFFQVVEQRGAVREGKLKEFQVIIRVAVEFQG